MKSTFVILGLLVAIPALLFACNRASKPPVRSIPGIKPADVYGALEQRGFTVEKRFDATGNIWTCRQEHPSVSYTAQLLGMEGTSFFLVNGQVMADAASKDAQAGIDFLSFLGSVPYEGAEPQAAREWVIANYDIDKATTRFGTVQFTINAPSPYYRMLVMEQVD